MYLSCFKNFKLLLASLFFIFFFYGKDTFAYYKLTASSKATPTGITLATMVSVGTGVGTAAGNVIVCTSSTGSTIQEMCPNPSSICTSISSASNDGTPVAICTPAGMEYCRTDDDCTALGRSKCLDAPNSSTLFTYTATEFGLYGICGSLAATSESNVMVDALCSGIKLVTGKAGRAFVAICVVVLGVLFFTGKVSWNMVLAAALGCGGVFGAPSIVGVVTGKPLTCR